MTFDRFFWIWMFHFDSRDIRSRARDMLRQNSENTTFVGQETSASVCYGALHVFNAQKWHLLRIWLMVFVEECGPWGRWQTTLNFSDTVLWTHETPGIYTLHQWVDDPDEADTQVVGYQIVWICHASQLMVMPPAIIWHQRMRLYLYVDLTGDLASLPCGNYDIESNKLIKLWSCGKH